MNSELPEEMLGLVKVSALLGINQRTVWRRVQDGSLKKPVKVGRCARWFASDIVSFQQRLRQERGE